MAPPLLLVLAACAATAPPAVPHPADTPRWSTAPFVAFAPLDAVGERAIAIDVPGGPVDRLLADADVTTVLTDRFSTIFLHPRARPELTDRFGWPSLTLVDGDGCLRATVLDPADPAALLAALNEALRRRRDDVRVALPAPWPRPRPPGGPEDWTLDNPDAARPFLDATRGAPALVLDGRPFLYGNRRDALFFADTPEGAAFLARLPAGAPAAPEAGPSLRCPLPAPPSGG